MTLNAITHSITQSVRLFGVHDKNVNEDRPILLEVKYRLWALGSGNKRFMWIFAGVSWRGASNDVGLVDDVFLSSSWASCSSLDLHGFIICKLCLMCDRFILFLLKNQQIACSWHILLCYFSVSVVCFVFFIIENTAWNCECIWVVWRITSRDCAPLHIACACLWLGWSSKDWAHYRGMSLAFV